MSVISLSSMVEAQDVTNNSLRGKPEDIEGCTALILEKEMSDNNPGKTFLACLGKSGITYTVNGNGVHKGWIKERTKDGSLVSGESVLSFPPGTSKDSRNGQIYTPSPPGLEKKKNGRHLAIVQENETRSVLVVRVVANDSATTQSKASLSDSVFGTNGDPVNLKSQYQECSYNKFTFNPAVGTDIADGVTEVTIDMTVAGVSDSTVRTAVDNALLAKFGSSWFSLYDHYMYCLPPGTAGGWIAYAYINSKKSVYNDNWCTYVSGQMHELGHNLNLAHSGETATYDDQSGMMGYSYSSDDGPKMCFNAAKNWQLPWYNNRKFEVSSSVPKYQGPLVGITSGDPDVNGPPMVIKLNQLGSSTDYYINFNRRNSFNSGTQEGGDNVMVVQAGAEGNGYSTSILLAKLAAGGTYTIANFDGTSTALTVTVNSIDLITNIADVSICLGSCATSPPTSTPTKAPVPATPAPTKAPSVSPTVTPTKAPVPATPAPTKAPTVSPTATPTKAPVPATPVPTKSPTVSPTASPSRSPIVDPGCSSIFKRKDCRVTDGCVWEGGLCVIAGTGPTGPTPTAPTPTVPTPTAPTGGCSSFTPLGGKACRANNCVWSKGNCVDP